MSAKKLDAADTRPKSPENVPNNISVSKMEATEQKHSSARRIVENKEKSPRISSGNKSSEASLKMSHTRLPSTLRNSTAKDPKVEAPQTEEPS